MPEPSSSSDEDLSSEGDSEESEEEPPVRKSTRKSPRTSTPASSNRQTKKRPPPTRKSPRNVKKQKIVHSEEEEEDSDQYSSSDDQSSDSEDFIDFITNITQTGKKEQISGLPGDIRFPVYRDPSIFKNKIGLNQVEKILTWYSDNLNDVSKRIYLVKWENICYRKCAWISRSILADIATQKLRNYDKTESPCCNLDDQEIFSPAYLQVQHIIASKPNKSQYLVKWRNTGYEECTWEPASELTKEEIVQFEMRNDYKRATQQAATLHKQSKEKIGQFKEQPVFITGGSSPISNLHSLLLPTH